MSASEWTYHNPVKVVFRRGAIGQLDKYVQYDRVVLVTSPGFRQRGLAATVEKTLGPRLAAVVDDVKPNPDLVYVQAQGDRLRPAAPEALIALGGGSTIDTAKALAWLLAQPEGTQLAARFRAGAPASKVSAIPLIALPSTSGTGAEVTPFGTVWDYERRVKCSVAGDDLYPKLALLDPELTLALPEDVTVSSGLDAVSHALESTWNRNASPASLALTAKSLALSLRALPLVVAEPDNFEARADMMQASALAGLAISQSRTALAHAISYPLTAHFGLPHGLACSFTLPALLEFNAKADDGRLADLARYLGYSAADELKRGLTRLLHELDVRERLARHLPDRQSVMELSKEMFAPGRAENNLRPASDDDVKALVNQSLDALDLRS